MFYFRATKSFHDNRRHGADSRDGTSRTDPGSITLPRLSPNRVDGPVPLRCRGTGYAYSVKILRAESLHDHRRARAGQGGAGAEGG